jgi:hypothetical protein
MGSIGHGCGNFFGIDDELAFLLFLILILLILGVN